MIKPLLAEFESLVETISPVSGRRYGVIENKDKTMPIVRIPTPLRPHAGGLDRVEAAGSTVGEILKQLVTSTQPCANGLFDGTSCGASSTST